MSSIWMIVFIALVLLELATINLVSIWFALGALASFVVSLVSDNSTLQIVVFIGVSLISLISTRGIVKKIRTKETVPTNLDRVVGKVGTVTEEITKFNPGEVKVDGKRWTAVSDRKIIVGRKVEILSIEGVKLSVKELEEEK